MYDLCRVQPLCFLHKVIHMLGCQQLGVLDVHGVQEVIEQVPDQAAGEAVSLQEGPIRSQAMRG